MRQKRMVEPQVVEHRRIDVVIGLVILGLSLMVIRAVDLQWLQADDLSVQADNQRIRQYDVDAPRGPILDRTGRVLSESVEMPSIAAIASDIKTEDLPALAKALDMPLHQLKQRIGKRKGFVWLSRRVAPQTAKAVQALDLAGVRIEKEWRRYHPFGPETGHLVGFVGTDNHGLEGLELAFNSKLSGKPGRVQLRRAANGYSLPGSTWLKKPVMGESLKLNLDVSVQSIAYSALANGIAKTGAKGGSVVIMNPHNGHVLAMTSWPGFNPNSFGKYRPKDWRNRVVTDVFEPGSVLKPFTVAAALSTGQYTMDSLIYCENGKFTVADKTIKDDHPEGWIDLRKLLVVSSNIGAAKLALDIGKEDLNRVLTDVGFHHKTGIGLGGESAGILPPVQKWGPVETANIAFGQGVAVTPIQLAAAFSVFANGGIYYPPQLVQEGQPVKGRQVVSERVARDVLSMLADVTKSGGTGTKAVPLGYTVAGKTGTAQKPNGKGGYSKDKFTAVFAGLVPAEAPELVIVVVLDEPESSIYGGSTAAPVFKQIAAAALPVLGIAPTMDSNPSDWKVMQASVQRPTVAEHMQSLYGLSLREVRRFALLNDIQLRVHGEGWVVKSEPVVLQGLEAGDALEVWLRE
ncbi:penicillin-binding transpeptidase domain-containing protein [Ghiorsea bivora]|uniref:penicillin-binding transpeptidase domain-containing protein n=1 Tax=Ghiorsea bivora TaxID=1485545 RepID=UPI0009DF4D7F|nr:penicillin-binding transpeptidase domain-containing protein [Ghiorsea bivora]